MNNELDTRISELRTKKARLFFEQQEVKRLHSLQAKFSRELEQHREKVNSRAREREERERKKLDDAASSLQVSGSGRVVSCRVVSGRVESTIILAWRGEGSGARACRYAYVRISNAPFA